VQPYLAGAQSESRVTVSFNVDDLQTGPDALEIHFKRWEEQRLSEHTAHSVERLWPKMEKLTRWPSLITRTHVSHSDVASSEVARCTNYRLAVFDGLFTDRGGVCIARRVGATPAS